MLADRLVVMDAGHVLQQGSPEAIHRAPRNARVADLVGIQNRFTGQWMGVAEQAGWGLLRWTLDGGDVDQMPTLRVRDKGRIAPLQAVTWVIPGDGIAVLDRLPQTPGEFAVEVIEARHLGEITLVSLALTATRGVQLTLTLAGPQRLAFAVGATLGVRLDLDRVHVMPLRERTT